MRVLHAESAAELERATLEAAAAADVVVMAAAVSDYRPAAPTRASGRRAVSRGT